MIAGPAAECKLERGRAYGMDQGSPAGVASRPGNSSAFTKYRTGSKTSRSPPVERSAFARLAASCAGVAIAKEIS